MHFQVLFVLYVGPPLEAFCFSERLGASEPRLCTILYCHCCIKCLQPSKHGNNASRQTPPAAASNTAALMLAAAVHAACRFYNRADRLVLAVTLLNHHWMSCMLYCSCSWSCQLSLAAGMSASGASSTQSRPAGSISGTVTVLNAHAPLCFLPNHSY
jgi:hypothetical protein